MSEQNERELQLLRKHLLALASGDAPLLSHPINDLFIQVDGATGQVRFYDDTDTEISHFSIFAWQGGGSIDAPEAGVIETLRESITRLEQKGYWDKPLFSRPFAIELVGADFHRVEELLFLDEDLIKLDEPLLEGLSEDLDQFLSDLLADIK